MVKNPKTRRVKISKQRQISIPKDFYDTLNFKDEALIEVSNSSLVIRPAQSEVVDFSEFILKDLIAEGYADEELLNQFQKVKGEIPTALDKMSAEAMNSEPMTGDMSLDEFLDGLQPL